MGDPFTPLFVEVQTGDQLAPVVEKEFGGPGDPRLTEYIEFVGRQMVPFSKRSNFQHSFKVLGSKDVINAFALGNGNIYITRGLLDLLEDEAELAEILGHEMGHVANRHIGHSIDQAVGLSLLLGVAEAFYSERKGGTLTDRQQELVNTANAVIPGLILNGYSRSHEYEADEDGLKFMARAGYDPMGAVRVFERFQKLEPKVSALDAFFQSHPSASKRIDALASEINTKFPGFQGDTHRDRYQEIVFGGYSLGNVYSPRILGMSVPVAVAAAAVVTAAGIVAAAHL